VFGKGIRGQISRADVWLVVVVLPTDVSSSCISSSYCCDILAWTLRISSTQVKKYVDVLNSCMLWFVHWLSFTSVLVAPDWLSCTDVPLRNYLPTIRKCVIVTHRRSVVKRGGCFQRRLFVCQFFLSVCLFVRTITSERLNIGRWNLVVRCIVQKSRPSSNVKVKDQRSRSPGTKKAKKMLSYLHWQCIVRRRVRCRPYAACTSRWVHCVATQGWQSAGSARSWRLACGFVQSGPWGHGYAGWKISTCCLVM